MMITTNRWAPFRNSTRKISMMGKDIGHKVSLAATIGSLRSFRASHLLSPAEDRIHNYPGK
jgi:hypothetical protein